MMAYAELNRADVNKKAAERYNRADVKKLRDEIRSDEGYMEEVRRKAREYKKRPYVEEKRRLRVVVVTDATKLKMSEKQKLKRKRPEEIIKNKARYEVRKALDNGSLIKGDCSVCGSNIKIHGHHHDYFKPLDIIWLCPSHHHKEHARLNEIERNKK
tara:strand:+ start:273 stop:743 length:471 start_codon:yes stop_codon:yes gene_type:complete